MQRVYPGQKINLVGTLLAVLAFGITGGNGGQPHRLSNNRRGILPAEGRFLVSHTVRTAILIGYLADYDVLILRFADLYAAARRGI